MRIVKISIITLILLFLGLYFFYNNGYYTSKIKEEQLLMEQKIDEYEQDLQNGIDVSVKDYSLERKNYSNDYTKINLKIGKSIEELFQRSIKLIFNKMNNAINE